MQVPPEPEASSRFSRRGEGGRGKTPAFELKGMVAPLTVLRLRSSDVALIERQLRLKVAEMPQFFQDAPVLLDLGALGPSAAKLPFGELASILRGCKMVPVAVTQAEDETRSRAAAAGFGYVAPSVPRAAGRPNGAALPHNGGPTSTVASAEAPALSSRENADTRPATLASEAAAPTASPSASASRLPGASSTTPAPAASAPPEEKTSTGASATSSPRPHSHRPPVVIRQPVRSGQIIYAEATDLVILAPVNPGAEVVADGHVHIYATLRGRAVAGAQGMTDARIFCQKLEPELVAIAGAYLLSDDIPVDRRGKPAQIHLEDGVCRVLAL